MVPSALQAAGNLLANTWLNAGAIKELRAELKPTDYTEAYAIQDEMARAIGLPVVGWKLGATSPAVQRKEKNALPTLGRIFSSTVFSSPAKVSAQRFPRAGMESELAFEILKDIKPRPEPYTSDELRDRVVLRPAIEIIGGRYAKGPGAPVLALFDEIADNVQGWGLVIGPPVTNWEKFNLQQLPIEFRINGEEPAPNPLGADRCIPLDVLAHAASILSARGIGLLRGQIISTGGLTEPRWLNAGDAIVVDFGPLGTLNARYS
jgi:2-oxo-3-hexenedioate decarboxylase/2-keto-4-pentenoate hydratase